MSLAALPLAPAAAVGTLRLRGPRADTPAVRLRAARELAGAELAPGGLAPAAVLLVRRLADPLPGGFGGGGPRPRADWERAVRDELAAAARTAERPDERGRLPAGAAAVLFADDAELLACLLADRARGEDAGRWWWRLLLPRLGGAWSPGRSGRDPAPLLAARPRELPAAFAHLVRWGEAARVAGALDATGARRTLAALVHEHALSPALLPLTAGQPAGGEPAPGDRSPAPEPWHPWLPSAVAGAAVPVARAVAGLALGLVHAPRRVRSAPFAAAVQRWWQAAVEAGLPSLPPAAEGRPRQPAGPRAETIEARQEIATEASVPKPRGEREAAARPQAGWRQDDHGGATDAAPPPTDALGTFQLKRLPPSGDAAPQSSAASVASSSSAEPTDHAAAPAPVELGTPSGQPQGLQRPPAEAPSSPPPSSPPTAESAAPAAAAPEAGTAPPWDASEAVATRAAGLFYLIHLLADLDLPAAGEPGWRLGRDAGPWGTLDLLGRGLLAHRFPALANDPLWRLLAVLAGWPDPDGEPLSASTRRDPPWRAPAPWAERLADPLDACRWSAAGARLRLWSDAGWLLADVPRTAAPPSRQARRELKRYAAARSGNPAALRRAPAAAAPRAALPPLAPGCPPRLGRWAAAVVPAARRRLLLALGTDSDRCDLARGAAGDPVDRLLAVPGTIHCTSSHLDLVLDGECAELAVRRAGLDRDPGWRPELGRVVLFHFL